MPHTLYCDDDDVVIVVVVSDLDSRSVGGNDEPSALCTTMMHEAVSWQAPLALALATAVNNCYCYQIAVVT